MELMDRLCSAVGRPDDSVALVTCGTLGVEVAVGLARSITRVRDGKRRGDILTSTLSYHGMSALTLALAGNHARSPRPEDALGLGPGFPAPYPPTHAHQGHACDSSCAFEIAQEIDRRGAENVAALLIEPVNGTTGGAYVPPDGYLRRVSEICRERDVLVIHDEVLTGLWRTGTPLASRHWEGCEPDMVILSKGLGAGYTGVGAVTDIRGLGHLYGVEVAPGQLWPVMRAAEDRGVFFYPFTGAGEPRSEGLVVAPPLISTDEDIEFLIAALSDALDSVS